MEFQGFYEKEDDQGRQFRWSKSESVIKVNDIKQIKVKIESCFPNVAKKNQKIFVFIDEKKSAELDLTQERNSFILEFKNLSKGSKIKFFSDSQYL